MLSDHVRDRIHPAAYHRVSRRRSRSIGVGADPAGNEMMTVSIIAIAIMGVPIAPGQRDVPVISRFFGIVISMHFREHGPAHFHARYAEHWASIEIESESIHGHLPGRVRQLVLE